MKRTATVQTVSRVDYPPADHQEVLEVRTDLPEHLHRAIYLNANSLPPAEGEPITWGDRRAWYQVAGKAIVASKVGYSFDPDQPSK